MSDFQRGDRVRTTRGRVAHAYEGEDRDSYWGGMTYFACDGAWADGHETQTVTAASDDLPPCKRCDAELRKEFNKAKDTYERWNGVGA